MMRHQKQNHDHMKRVTLKKTKFLMRKRDIGAMKPLYFQAGPKNGENSVAKTNIVKVEEIRVDFD